MDIPLDLTLDLPARVDVVHVCVKNDFEHHLRVIWAAATLPVQLFELLDVKTLTMTTTTHTRLSPLYLRWDSAEKTACRCY